MWNRFCLEGRRKGEGGVRNVSKCKNDKIKSEKKKSNK
jgi:hypothetical protein